MVAAGAGITLLPEMAVDVEARADRGLVCVPLARPQPARTIVLAWRRSSPRARELRLFGQLFAAAVPAERRLL